MAERYPELVRQIAAAGHEIASHGYSHQLIYRQTPEVFRAETLKSKQILEDITGTAVTGYRAASYSITRQSLWALDILGQLGFTWDSSIFPTRHDNYGIPGSPEEPYLLITDSGARLTEFPSPPLRCWANLSQRRAAAIFGSIPIGSPAGYLRGRVSRAQEPDFYLHPGRSTRNNRAYPMPVGFPTSATTPICTAACRGLNAC